MRWKGHSVLGCWILQGLRGKGCPHRDSDIGHTPYREGTSPHVSLLGLESQSSFFNCRQSISEVKKHSINPYWIHSSTNLTFSEPPCWQIEYSVGIVLSVGLNCVPPSPILTVVCKGLWDARIDSVVWLTPMVISRREYMPPPRGHTIPWRETGAFSLTFLELQHPFALPLVYT